MGLLWDDIANGQVVISFPHHEVHDGDTFIACYKSPEGTDIEDDASLDIVLVPARATALHFTFAVAAAGDAEFFIYEGSNTDIGTAIPTYNLNRVSGKISNLFIKHTPSITAVGTMLCNVFLPGGTKNQANGGSTRQDTEYILAPLTKYLFRLTNRAGSAKVLGWNFSWYEKDV